MASRRIRTSRVVAMLLLLPLRASALATPAPASDAMHGLKGRQVVVLTKRGGMHAGTLVHVDARTVTVHLGDWKSTTIQRRLIVTIAPVVGSVPRSMRTVRTALPRGHLESPALSKKLLLGRLTGAQTTLGIGVAMLVFGTSGVIAGILGAIQARREAERSPSSGCSTSWSDDAGYNEPCEFKIPGFGHGVLAAFGVAVGLVGLSLTLVGASRWARYSRMLERYRPIVTIDPAQGRYGVAMGMSF